MIIESIFYEILVCVHNNDWQMKHFEVMNGNGTGCAKSCLCILWFYCNSLMFSVKPVFGPIFVNLSIDPPFIALKGLEV